MNYWVIIGEGGGFEEVKSIKSNSSAAQSDEIKKLLFAWTILFSL